MISRKFTKRTRVERNTGVEATVCERYGCMIKHAVLGGGDNSV